eukprot:XP_011663350.1 PREDICTED: uncharacterized protein LOC105437901 [Strongylocentrotus purpuratus]
MALEPFSVVKMELYEYYERIITLMWELGGLATTDELLISSEFRQNFVRSDNDTSDQDLCDAGWTRNGNACYQLVESTVDYSTALDACRNLNDYGDLASVADQDESNFLFVYSRRTFDTSSYWIGFNDLDEEGAWAWTDGSVTSYTNWYSGEPSGGSEHCGVLRWSSDGTWYDASCSSTFGYICKYPLNTISCAEWKRKGYTSNGFYTIDPDGRNNGVDPYRVYCDMTTDASTGITTFEHQETNRSLVTDVEAPFSFIRNITYGDKSVNQVATGADISGECYQYIKYECYHSVITGFAAWYDRDGTQKNYWGGATVDTRQCACGISGSCTNGHQCNCDNDDDAWREDSGYLTDKTTLPVTEMRFGDTGQENEYGYYTLGPLYCKGDESFLVTGRTDFMFIKERYLHYNNNAVLSSITVAECAQACVSAFTFICRSFDYEPSYNRCYLSEENDLTVNPYSGSVYHMFVRIMDRIEDSFTGDDDTSDQDLCDAGWTRSGNACYQLVESTVDYTTALDACRNLNDYGDLASVADQDESNFLLVLSRRTFDTNYYWIGFNDLEEEGTWAWTDGSVTSYTNWYSGESSGGSEHCGVLRLSSDGTWYDASCSSTYGYICKYPLNTISCAEWKRKGYTSNGYYTIDPDGRNNGVDPYKVYCDMTTDASTGITTFEHQEANRSLVAGAQVAFSFIRNITYGDKSVDQVATGADISGECYQYIKYECHASYLTGYTAWYDRDGKQKNYWGGATVDSGQCACGISGSCTNGHQCNCDTDDDAWREDSGYLTDKTTLPVTEMRFGDTGDTVEYGYYTLGPLYCKGDDSLDRIEDPFTGE